MLGDREPQAARVDECQLREIENDAIAGALEAIQGPGKRRSAFQVELPRHPHDRRVR
jgi:hypothetical protein